MLDGIVIVTTYSGVLGAPSRKARRESRHQYPSREMCASQFNRTNKPSRELSRGCFTHNDGSILMEIHFTLNEEDTYCREFFSQAL